MDDFSNVHFTVHDKLESVICHRRLSVCSEWRDTRSLRMNDVFICSYWTAPSIRTTSQARSAPREPHDD